MELCYGRNALVLHEATTRHLYILVDHMNKPKSMFFVKNNALARTLIGSLVAVLYGVLLASFSNEYFRDRDSYVVYASSFNEILGRYDTVALFFNEPLFIFYNQVLSNFFSPDLVPRFGVFLYQQRSPFLL